VALVTGDPQGLGAIWVWFDASSHSDWRGPSGMLSPWVSEQMEGPGTRDAPRGWRLCWWRSYQQKKVRGFRVPGSVLCGSARTAALFHPLGAI